MLSKLIRKVRNAASLYIDKTRAGGGRSVEYKYEDFSILLPANHMLPRYQRRHPKYDRFLPYLAQHIKPEEAIIDVGANVGDTLAGMVEKNSTSTYICVEPDDNFFEYLTKNISRIKNSKPHLTVHAVKSLVGKNISGVSLEGCGGTKHAVLCKDGKITSRPLDNILDDLENSFSIRILKTDVDGFDYDVIESSLILITKKKPIIFFECQYDHEEQKSGYEKILLTLEGQGYCDWAIFDNFGEVILRTSEISLVGQLMNYIWSQNLGNTTRTIFYYDVLAAQDGDKELIDSVLAEYSQFKPKI